MAKIVKRVYRCKCGRTRPSNRKWCYTCRPRYSRCNLAESDEPYTLADRVAIARACDISYGQLMAIVHMGGEPPLKRPVDWPEGSAHAGGVRG